MLLNFHIKLLLKRK